MGLIKEFKDFLKEYKVMALAIAFIMGGAINNLVQSLVKDLFMPLITQFVPEGGWETATLTIGAVVLKWGSFLSALINFVVLAFVIFIMAKLVLKEDVVKKK